MIRGIIHDWVIAVTKMPIGGRKTVSQSEQVAAILEEIRQIKGELANQNRVRLIREIVERRGIDTLCHFTLVDNLSSILRLGLLGTSNLLEERVSFTRIDRDRIDGFLQAVCMSISFPNYKLFRSKRESFRDLNGVGLNRWVVLLLEARLLWELECAFCSYNASANTVTRVSIDERKKPEALEAMFGDMKSVSRGKLNFPPHFTSSPQAEILVFDAVPPSFISEIHFSDDDTLYDWVSTNEEGTGATFRVSDYYFSDRTSKRSI